MNYTFELLKNAVELFSPCMGDYLYIYDLIGDTYYISERAVERFNVPAKMFQDVQKAHEQFVYPEDLPKLQKDLDDLISGKKASHNLYYRWVSKEGRPVWINCQGRVVMTENPTVKLMIGCINEIGKKQAADNVSGLLGEEAFRVQVARFRGLPKCFIMRIGIDDFKSVNERLGSDYGNQVLNDVAKCIMSSVQLGQFAFRMQSDEFLIFDTISEEDSQIRELYEEIRRKNDEILEKEHYEVLYTLSCGVISYRDIETLDFAVITKLTQFALSQAKENGKNQIYFFEQKDYDQFVAERELTTSLRRSVANDFLGFELYFQPIMHATTGRIFAAEALIRFRKEDGTLISPYSFITQLEKSGLIIPVGRWIFHQALKACEECRKYIPDFKVSINLSYVQLLKSPVFTDLIDAIEQYDVPPSSVIVELTESGYLDENAAVSNIWRKLKKYGILIAIDDFGTGYSNLMNISDLQPDILKIDREFTLKALKNDYENNLFRHIIEMVHSLGIQEVVEGIEEKEELDHMVAMGPDFIQGYYYSMPKPIPEFMDQFMKKECL